MCDDRSTRKGHAQRVVSLEIRIRGGRISTVESVDVKLAWSAGDGSFLVSRVHAGSWQIVCAQRFPGEDTSWGRINARRVLVNLAGEPLIDQVAKLNVVIGEDDRRREEHSQRGPQQRQIPSAMSKNPRAIRIRNKFLRPVAQQAARRDHAQSPG